MLMGNEHLVTHLLQRVSGFSRDGFLCCHCVRKRLHVCLRVGMRHEAMLQGAGSTPGTGREGLSHDGRALHHLLLEVGGMLKMAGREAAGLEVVGVGHRPGHLLVAERVGDVCRGALRTLLSLERVVAQRCSWGDGEMGREGRNGCVHALLRLIGVWVEYV